MTRFSIRPHSLLPAPGPYCDPLEGCLPVLFSAWNKKRLLRHHAAPDMLMTDTDTLHQAVPSTHVMQNQMSYNVVIYPPSHCPPQAGPASGEEEQMESSPGIQRDYFLYGTQQSCLKASFQ